MKQTSESRRRQRPPKKKWMAPLAVLILGLGIIGGYFYVAQQQTKRGMTESQQSAIKKVTSKQHASKSSAVKPSDMGRVGSAVLSQQPVVKIMLWMLPSFCGNVQGRFYTARRECTDSD
ncbi:hypothetical protein V3472_02190 [Lacticaseibacillus rhamnosus]